MNLNGIKRNCPSCGAPITTEICPYCHVATGLDTRTADMEYPVIECKEARVGFWNCVFPAIFAFAFGIGGLAPLVMALAMKAVSSEVGEASGFFSSSFVFFGFSSIIFLPIGVIALVLAIKPLIRNAKIKANGKDIEATVYGYMDDNILLNGHPAQIVKLLVTTEEGPKFILYQLGDIKQPFKINSKINLKVYKDIFLIENKKKYYF